MQDALERNQNGRKWYGCLSGYGHIHVTNAFARLKTRAVQSSLYGSTSKSHVTKKARMCPDMDRLSAFVSFMICSAEEV